MKALIPVFVLAMASVVMAAESYRITLFQTSYLGNTEVAAGDYTLVVDDARVMIKRGSRTLAESAAKVETNTEPFSSTTVRYNNGDGRNRISEIRVGRTATRIVVE